MNFIKNKKVLTNFFIVIAVFLAGFFLLNRTPQTATPQEAKYVKIGGQMIRVDLATTPTAQAQGLSGREGLEDNEGLLFVFDKSGKYPFWMKDMKFAIDIIWIGEDNKIVYIEKSVLPESYPATFGGKDEARYVLEVNARFSEKYGLEAGDGVEFLK